MSCGGGDIKPPTSYGSVINAIILTSGVDTKLVLIFTSGRVILIDNAITPIRTVNMITPIKAVNMVIKAVNMIIRVAGVRDGMPPSQS